MVLGVLDLSLCLPCFTKDEVPVGALHGRGCPVDRRCGVARPLRGGDR